MQAATCTAIIASREVRKRFIHKLFLTTEENLLAFEPQPIETTDGAAIRIIFVQHCDDHVNVQRLKTSKEESQGLIDAEKLHRIYASMLRVRSLRTQSQVRGARKRSQHLFSEACEVACTVDLKAQDTIAVSPLQNIVDVVRGPQMLDARVNPPQNVQRAISLNILTHEDSAERVTLATGIAFAHRVQQTSSVVIAFADGAEPSAVHRSAQFAFENQLPILYIQQSIPNNSRKPSRSKKQSQLATIPVDQNDAVAVYRVAYEAIDKARRGVGPTVIDAVGVPRTSAGSSNGAMQQHDPLEYMEWYLRRRNLWSDELKHGKSATLG